MHSALLVLVLAAGAQAVAPPRSLAVSRPMAKALAVRGGGVVDPAVAVKATSAVFGLYGLQMLAIPAKMQTDHFEGDATDMLKFWIRGKSAVAPRPSPRSHCDGTPPQAARLGSSPSLGPSPSSVRRTLTSLRRPPPSGAGSCTRGTPSLGTLARASL